MMNDEVKGKKAVRILQCPACRTGAMTRMICSAGGIDVLIDYCRRCGGVFLDREELETIVEAEIRLHDIQRKHAKEE